MLNLRNIFLMTMFLSVFIYAEKLSNDHITFSINSNSGTLGTGLDLNSPGLVYDGAEYLNSVGIPFEFFSIKTGNKVYANDNAEGYKKWWPKETRRLNSKNIPTTVTKNGETIVAKTILPGVFKIVHTYRIGYNRNLFNQDTKSKNMERNIAIDVKVTNLSPVKQKMKYTRGIDMDPPDIATKNSTGYRNPQGKTIIPKENIVYTISSKNPGKYPLSLFSEHKLAHQGAILDFSNYKGCLYDPDAILKNSIDPFQGDGVIYMIFDLGTVSAGETQEFSFSYYLDDDIKKLVDKIDRKNPKIKILPKQLQYNLKHHNKDVLETEKQSFKLHPTNKNFVAEDKSNQITVEIADGSVLPKGVTLVIGERKDLLSSNQKAVILSSEVKYNESIPLIIRYDENWKEDQKKSLGLIVGTSDKKGRFAKMSIVLNPLKDDSIVMKESQKLLFSIPYGEKKVYEKIDEKSFTLLSKASKGKQRSAKLLVKEGALPKGLQLKINGVPFEKTFNYRLGEPITLVLYRNRDYKAKKREEVGFVFKDNLTDQTVPITVWIEPVARHLEIKVNPKHPSVKLDKLKNANDTIITLYANGKEINGESFEHYTLKEECGKLNCKLIKDSEHKRFLLHVSPDIIEAFTNTGDQTISLKLEQGMYPKDYAEQTFTYTVEDTGLKKWIDPLVKLLLLLLLLWYLWGITLGKKRFKKSQVVTLAPIKRGKPERKYERDYSPRKLVNWWDFFIPYRAQRTYIENLHFTAVKNRQIYLSKRSQEMVTHNGLPIDNAGAKDMKLFPGDMLRTNRELYTIL